MPHEPTSSRSPAALIAVKVAHTIAWAFFAGCILAIPVASWQGNHSTAAWLTASVFVEVAIFEPCYETGKAVRWCISQAGGVPMGIAASTGLGSRPTGECCGP
jgi:hypothetical protein